MNKLKEVTYVNMYIPNCRYKNYLIIISMRSQQSLMMYFVPKNIMMGIYAYGLINK